MIAHVHEHIGGLTGAVRATVYLIGPSHGTREERACRFAPFVTALMALGYLVVAPGWSHPRTETADELLSLVDDDLDALAAADVVVTLPGSGSLLESSLAEAFRIPVVAFADLLSPVAVPA